MKPDHGAVIACAVLAAACSAAFVPATDDPWKKYLQACALMSVGRVLPAEPLMSQSLAYYEKSDEPLRLAMVEMQYALLIVSPGLGHSHQFAQRREAMGGQEALPQKARELNQRAKSNLERVIAAPASAAERTQALLVMVEVETNLGERSEACATIERAAESYKDAQGIPYSYAIYRSASVPEHLAERRRKLDCTTQAG